MTRNSDRADTRPLTSEPLEIAKADTECADLHLHRARELVSAELTPAQYAALDQLDDEIAELTKRIEATIPHRDWSLVRDLTRKVNDLTRRIARLAIVQRRRFATWWRAAAGLRFTPRRMLR
jgi:hypothetical protein